MIKYLLPVILLIQGCLSVQAQDKPMPEATQDNKLWALRAIVAERDFPDSASSKREYSAILYVLRNRWALQNSKGNHITFVKMARAYCTGLDYPKTPRQRWIHELTLSDKRPRHWNRTEKRPWPGRAVLEDLVPFLQDWFDGKIEDPYNGQAYYWGAPTDPRHKRQLPRKGFRNLFYKR